ncbi:acyl carrier protein [Terricaulis silvestris]|uniref:D-alanine--poly(Phosphoribitol) ligase subunit 2 n=1 Tax=Terricaulis silvestris TaxID=2686094 RepID=A0A6I6MHW2_9CAUL|nr:acyl carrier protein [Terricaulis silvestris]QGZ94049.1 D-alanine--poly(phosphoribitol) ligase subunit 2 [Terricaulis silvestris]
MSSVEQTIKAHILSEYLIGEDPDALATTTPLITSGILDSMAVLKLVLFLEEQFTISVDPHETTEEHMDTIEKIALFVRSKNASLA